MNVSLLEQTVAEDKPKTYPVKLPADVVETARIVSAYRNEPMSEMLGNILRPLLAKMEKEEVAKRNIKE